LDHKSNDIDHLLEKLEKLIAQQAILKREIFEIKSELEVYKRSDEKEETKADSEVIQKEPAAVNLEKPQELKQEEKPALKSLVEPVAEKKTDVAEHKVSKSFKIRLPESIQSNLEDFIGTNLINKIGIIVLIIGIGIGTKFVIDKNLISPLVRLVLGYFLGISMLFIAYRIKKNYHNFSAVLCSGSMAVLYLMTYAGIVFFGIFNLAVAFTIMVVITIFTVYQSLKYDREIISIIGLTGAYAIPFLISEESDNYFFLFSYIAIINLGILAVAIKKYWQLLYYIAFAFTWLIYVIWWQNVDFEDLEYFRISVLFSSIFFMIFYFSFLINKVLNKRVFSIEDVILIIANSFIYYGLAYVAFNNDIWEDLLGSFTLINASIHILVWVLIYYRKERDENLLRLIFGLVITFITIAIPVQFDGNWVTLFWIIEGTALFIIGRTRRSYFYEFLAYPVLVFALYSLMDDWRIAFARYASLDYEEGYTLFFNINFLVALITIACLAAVNYISYQSKYTIKKDMDPTFKSMIQYFLPGALIFVTFYTFRFEISIYFRQLYADSANLAFSGNNSNLKSALNEDILGIKTTWILIYSMLYFSLISIANIVKLKNEDIVYKSVIANAIVLFIFLSDGLYVLSELRESYISPEYPDKFIPGLENIYIRYIALIVFAYVLIINYRLIRQKYLHRNIKIYLDLFTYLAVLWILSSELLHWLDLGGYKSSYKLGLSILWGTYSLLLIIIGIWKKLKYLRICAILLFGITLIKLSVYDISGMDTISKTIVFILLGILLLIISFLYNKYRKIIF
jgi:uncharacterized membrane protein